MGVECILIPYTVNQSVIENSTSTIPIYIGLTVINGKRLSHLFLFHLGITWVNIPCFTWVNIVSYSIDLELWENYLDNN